MTRMTPFALVCAALLLGGCTSLLGGDSNPNKMGGPSAVTVPVGNNLVMPPDLQLPAPGSGAAPAYQAPAPTQSASLAKPGNASLYGGTAAGAPPQDIFQQYGISKTKPDGTPKTQIELSNELKAAIIRKKRLTNPSYGTIGNIGNIFSDQ